MAKYDIEYSDIYDPRDEGRITKNGVEIEREQAVLDLQLLDARLEALAWAQWISVEERLPETDGYYLAFTSSPWMQPETVGGVQTYYYHGNEKGAEFSGDRGVTHWMPLPPPPTP